MGLASRTSNVEEATDGGNGDSRHEGADRIFPEGWSAVRALIAPEEKCAMAEHFATHDLFVHDSEAAASERRASSAKIIVNPGTAPNTVVRKSLDRIRADLEDSPGSAAPHITWYTPGALVPATLLGCREKCRHMRNSCGLHLFPGLVDPDLEMVRGEEAIEYAKQLDECFTYAVLSAYAFDMDTGTAFFFYGDEVKLQQAVALREAAHKFLFLEPDKFKREGIKTYSIRQLLETSLAVTIYTVSSEKDRTIEAQFRRLAEGLLEPVEDETRNPKALRLVVVDGKVNLRFTGQLKSKSRKPVRD